MPPVLPGQRILVADASYLVLSYRGSCCAVAVLGQGSPLLVRTSCWTHFCSGFLFYDWLVSLADEVNLIWLSKSRRTIASIVYTFIRYTAIIDASMCVITINALAMPVSWLLCPSLQTTGSLGCLEVRVSAVIEEYCISN